MGWVTFGKQRWVTSGERRSRADHDLVVVNPNGFQGDERDVSILYIEHRFFSKRELSKLCLSRHFSALNARRR